MKKTFYASAALFLAGCFATSLGASTFDFTFGGPGVSGSVELTYGTATDHTYSQAYEVTGISGTFTDTNNGLDLVGVPIGSLMGIVHSTPDPTNLLAPADFSRYAVASGLPAHSGGYITYDNLYYPTGSPATSSDYTVHGGFLDIYGLFFNIGNGQMVDLWSNGDFTGTGNGPISYGVAVVTSANTLDYVSSGVSITPEPGAFGLAACALAGLVFLKRRARL